MVPRGGGVSVSSIQEFYNLSFHFKGHLCKRHREYTPDGSPGRPPVNWSCPAISVITGEFQLSQANETRAEADLIHKIMGPPSKSPMQSPLPFFLPRATGELSHQRHTSEVHQRQNNLKASRWSPMQGTSSPSARSSPQKFLFNCAFVDSL